VAALRPGAHDLAVHVLRVVGVDVAGSAPAVGHFDGHDDDGSSRVFPLG